MTLTKDINGLIFKDQMQSTRITVRMTSDGKGMSLSLADEKECNHCDYKQTAEQQSIEDCVSRKAVFETIDDCNSDGLKGIFCSYDDGERFKEYVKMLPPVTPTRKVGKWIRKPIRNEKGGCIGAEMICSYCKKDNEQDKKLAYCPNCGAEMRGAEKRGSEE